MTIFLFTNLFVAAPTVNYSWASRRRVCVTVAKSKCKCSLALAQHPPTQNTHEGSNESQLRAAGAGPGPGIRAVNEPSRRLKFYNHGEGPYYGFLLVESALCVNGFLNVNALEAKEEKVLLHVYETSNFVSSSMW